MDFLGLRTLTVIRDAVALIKKNHNIDVKIDELQMDESCKGGVIASYKGVRIFVPASQ